MFRAMFNSLRGPLAATLLVSSAFLPAACGGDDDDGGWKGETIPIGAIFSTTGDGTAFGPQQLKGAELAAEEINADDGVNGAAIELVQKDDAGDPAESARRMRELTEEDEAVAVLGPTFSNSSARAHPVANRAKTPVLAVSNTAPGIVGDCAYPCEYIFRDSLAEADAIPANVDDFYRRESPDSAAVIYPKGDPFGRTSADTARNTFGDNMVRTMLAEWPGGLPRAVGSNPDVVMVTASSGDAVVDIVRDLRREGYEGPVLGGNAFNSATASRELGAAGEGAQSAAAWFAGNDSEENQEFIDAYRKKYDEEPDQFAAQAYTGVHLLAEAAEEAELTFDDLAADREAVKNALEDVKEETPLGDFSFTEDHDVSQPIWIVRMDGNGGFELVEEVPPA
jgi:branched-chain amino acid transport system substrate-binding protein